MVVQGVLLIEISLTMGRFRFQCPNMSQRFSSSQIYTNHNHGNIRDRVMDILVFVLPKYGAASTALDAKATRIRSLPNDICTCTKI